MLGLLTCIAVAVHFVALLGRGMAADPNRVPWGNMYEFTLAGTFVVAAFYVGMHRRFGLQWMAPIVVGFVLTLLMVAVLWLYDPVAPLTEALNSYWLVIHVVSAILATGAFTLGGITSAVYLLKERRPDTTTGFLSRVPSLVKLDRISYRIHAFGFPVWTFAVLITGPDLGPPGVVVVLELGPQGGVGVHHLGRLRRLSARTLHRRLEGPQGRLARAARRRHAVVQLHRDQLLLDYQPALLRERAGGCRGRPRALSPGPSKLR